MHPEHLRGQIPQHNKCRFRALVPCAARHPPRRVRPRPGHGVRPLHRQQTCRSGAYALLRHTTPPSRAWTAFRRPRRPRLRKRRRDAPLRKRDGPRRRAPGPTRPVPPCHAGGSAISANHRKGALMARSRSTCARLRYSRLSHHRRRLRNPLLCMHSPHNDKSPLPPPLPHCITSELAAHSLSLSPPDQHCVTCDSPCLMSNVVLYAVPTMTLRQPGRQHRAQGTVPPSDPLIPDPLQTHMLPRL